MGSDSRRIRRLHDLGRNSARLVVGLLTGHTQHPEEAPRSHWCCVRFLAQKLWLGGGMLSFRIPCECDALGGVSQRVPGQTHPDAANIRRLNSELVSKCRAAPCELLPQGAPLSARFCGSWLQVSHLEVKS